MKKEEKNWLMQAERDMKSAKNSFKSKDYYLASFLCHQVVEKALKSLYIKKMGKIYRTHDLVFLSKTLSLPEEMIELCQRLNPAYIEARYPDAGDELPAFSYTKEDAESDIKDAEKVLEWIKKVK